MKGIHSSRVACAVLLFLWSHPLLLRAQATQGIRPLETTPQSTTQASTLPAPAARSRIAILEDPALVDRFQVNEKQAGESFNRCLLAFTKRSNLKEAWNLFISPDDTVGIHISTAGGPLLSTHRGLLEAVIKGLKQSGIPASRIIVWDKFGEQMNLAGYPPPGSDEEGSSTDDWYCASVIPGSGFDSQKFYFNEVVGQLIWGDFEFRGKAKTPESLLKSLDNLENKKGKKSGEEKPDEPPQVSNRSYFAGLVSRKVTKIINIPVMSDHQKLGINGCIASLTMASVDNNRRFFSPSEVSGLALAEIMSHESLKKKVVLHILDGLIVQFAGGPDFIPHYAASPGLLMIGQDPVALDTLTLERLEKYRLEKKVVPVGDDAIHLKICAKKGLGTQNKEQMDIIRVQ